MNDPKTLLHSTDKALLAAASETGPTDGIVPLTPDLMDSISQSLNARQKDIDNRYGELVANCPYETRLAVAAWVFRAIVDHATEGGTFRHLIYSRLGFAEDGYVPLYLAGGMTISNEFDLTKSEGVPE